MKIPEAPPALSDILYVPSKLERVGVGLSKGIGPAPGGRYYHWEKLRRLEPPDDMSSDEWWACIKIARSGLRRRIPLQDTQGRPFAYVLADPVLEMLHEIDRYAGSWFATEDAITNPQTRDRYIVSSLIEEAITSSQLEGAATTREIAKEMLRSGRAPLDRGERMILNNYLAMRLIRTVKDQPLTPGLIYQIHGEVTRETLPSASVAPFLRNPDDNPAVYDENDRLLHRPPPVDEIAERMDSMCTFANQAEANAFLHPVLKAILLHFWLAYDHPFIDGNGRTARALFYWSMLSQKFWLFEFISISAILKKAPAQYGRAFLYSETDENDLTYFVLYQLSVIQRAIEELRAFIERKTQEVRETERMLRSTVTLNHRQIALLGHALRHPGMRYTIDSHQKSHAVVYQTARTDLMDLSKRRLLDKTRAG